MNKIDDCPEDRGCETLGERSQKLLYRCGGRLKHMSEHMLCRETGRRSAGSIPSARLLPSGGRRRFSKADKKRILEEASQPGAYVSSVARRCGVGTRLLFPLEAGAGRAGASRGEVLAGHNHG